jgi:hypothetical protein
MCSSWWSAHINWRLTFTSNIGIKAVLFWSCCSYSIFQVVQGCWHWKNITKCHHTYTVWWQHSWLRSCLSNGSAKGHPHPSLHHLQVWSPLIFQTGFCKRWHSNSTNEQNEGSDINSNCWNWIASDEKCWAQSWLLPWCGQGNSGAYTEYK